MDNIYLQLETRDNKLKLPVMDATDIRYAISSMWKECGNAGSFGRYVDLVHEDGRELSIEEREEFFEQEDADCEIAIGDCWILTSIEFNEPLTKEQKVAILDIVSDVPHKGFTASLYSEQLVLQSKDEIHFTAFPNRNVRLRSARYEGIELEAGYESKNEIERLNKALHEINIRIKEELGIVAEELPFEIDWFDFREDSANYGDYKIVNLGDLMYDYVAF